MQMIEQCGFLRKRSVALRYVHQNRVVPAEMASQSVSELIKELLLADAISYRFQDREQVPEILRLQYVRIRLRRMPQLSDHFTSSPLAFSLLCCSAGTTAQSPDTGSPEPLRCRLIPRTPKRRHAPVETTDLRAKYHRRKAAWASEFSELVLCACNC
jgi:hypothetical protein